LTRSSILGRASSLDDRLGRGVAAWVRWQVGHARLVAAGSVLLALVLLPVAASRLGLNSDEEALFARGASYDRAREEFKAAFPALFDAVLVVIDAATVDAAEDASARLAERLRTDPEHFPNVHRPEGGTFFEEHGFLYVEPVELEAVLDRLVEAQPYLGTLTRDGSLRGLADVLRQAATATASGELERFEFTDVFDGFSQALRARLDGEARPLSWGELLLGDTFAELGHRRLLLVQPKIDYGALQPAGETLDGLRQAIAELGLGAGSDVTVRITGLFALSEEESELVAGQATLAGAASLLLVAIVLVGGLRSGRLVLAIIATLLFGLVATAAFAAIAVGHLNLISVAFAVLFIGLSVDFGIHFGLAYRDRALAGEAVADALTGAGRDVGGSLVVCSLTTAIGFYAFLGTDFRGVAELGLIAGTGMAISLVSNLTLLPVLLALWTPQLRPSSSRPGGSAGWLGLPLRRPWSVVAAAFGLAAGAAVLAPSVEFDANPLRVRDPSAQSVQAFDDLLADGLAPWNVNVLAEDAAEADSLAERLEALPSVDHTQRLADFVPEAQSEKLALLDDAAFLLLPSLSSPVRAVPPTQAQQIEALERLAASLAPLETARHAELARASSELRAALSAWLVRSADAPEAAVAELERDLLGSLPHRLERLRWALTPTAVTVERLPEDLRRMAQTPDGRVRIEVFPSEDLNDPAALERYVESVLAVAPGSFGEGAVILEIGRTVVRAFREALAVAALGIALVLLVVWRNLRDSLLVAAPIGFAALLTAAATVLIGMPLNFANVIVIPLLLGMGVDTGIHLVHRVRGTLLPGKNLLRTTTARAVVLSALTTAASFGTLGFSTHRGMASLGQLLAIGIALILVANLIVLPALVVLADRRTTGGS
jgi:hopanoid biosynthesis associated RND transporter like protein HpnN